MYLVIRATEDGLLMQLLDKTQMELWLNQRCDPNEYQEPPKFMVTLPHGAPNCWEDGSVLIMKGEIVVPKAVQFVTKMGLP